MRTQGFSSPIIAMQNIPAAPEPTSLVSVLQSLLKSDIFRDITGLTETQKNALKAFLKSLGMAETLSGEALRSAAKIAFQKSMEKNVDKAMRVISQAKEQGLLSDEEAKELAKDVIKTFIGGGDEEEKKESSEDSAEE